MTAIGNWVDQRACDLGFFELREFEARELCDQCPVRIECLTYAMRCEQGMPGHFRRELPVYGGLTGPERLKLAASP